MANIVSQLEAVEHRPGLWAGCPPLSGRVDDELALMINRGWVRWRARGGYEITALGLNRLSSVRRRRK